VSTGLPQAFLDVIVANIDDDSPRLMYADWLDEQGDADRAEFIRVQVERARLPARAPEQVRLRVRERDLLKRHGEAWLAELPAVRGARWEGFRRGIVAEVSFESFEAMRLHARACRAVAPVEAATVHWPRRREPTTVDVPIAELRELTLTGRPFEEEIDRLADSPQLSTVRTLTLLGLGADDLDRMFNSPHLSGLRSLRLVSNGLGSAGVRALTGFATLKSLEELDLSGPGYYAEYYDDPILNAAGMEALAGWAGLAGVRSLTLSGSDIGPAGLRALLGSPHAGALRRLSLRRGRFDGPAMAEFGSAVTGPRLEALDLGENVLKDVGAEYLATAPCLSELQVLRLDRCEIGGTGARLFARKASFLDELSQLDVSHNSFGPTGLAELLARQSPSLHTLRMRDNDLLDQGAKLLSGSAASNPLLEVDLSRNGLGDAAAQALGESAHLRGLLVLRLADNKIGKAAANALAASPLGKRLADLEVEDLRPAARRRRDGGDEIPF
jgi:uncharacterized protein (TIGR02996 family)